LSFGPRRGGKRGDDAEPRQCRIEGVREQDQFDRQGRGQTKKRGS